MTNILTKSFWNDYHRHPICLLPQRYEINHWQEVLAVIALVTTIAMATLVVLLATGILGGGALDVVAASIGIAAGIPLFITVFVGVGKDTTPPKKNDSDSGSETDEALNQKQQIRKNPQSLKTHWSD